MAVSALAQLLDQQPTAYAEVLAACRAMGWNASPTAQPADLIDELPSNVLPFIRRMLALLIYGDGSADSPAVVPVTERCYAQLVPRVTSPNYPAAGFPSDRDPFTHAPSDRNFAHLEQALSALSARKISGVPEAADGESIVRLLGDKNVYNTITEITDSTYGWTLQNIYNAKTAFPNCTKVTIGCKEIDMTFFGYQVGIILGGTNQGCDCEYHFPNLKKITPKVTGIGYVQGIVGVSQTHDVYCPELEEIDTGAGFGFVALVNASNTEPYSIYMPKLRSAKAPMFDQYDVNHSTGIEKLVLGPIETAFTLVSTRYGGLGLPNLIHLEFGEGTCANLDCSRWSPTLDSSNLDQFLQNFRSHIALRLTDNGSGKTLTLSQAVYDAIKDETHLFVFDEGTMTIYAYLTNIKHWTVTK